MSGYTPVFEDIYKGSLHGRWPAAAVWASLLPLIDKHGLLDMSPQAIVSSTGWPMDLLLAGIEELTKPDPQSRTPDHDGRRLVLIDPNRSWGWRVVNHGLYREKARSTAQNAKQVADGRNAEKVRRYRDRKRGKTTPGDTARHPVTPETPGDTLSNTNINYPIGRFAAQEPSPRKLLFDLGKFILGGNSGGLISQAISRTDEETVGRILGEMAMKPKADPKGYFVKATTPKERGVVV